ncbi:MAG: hypothetical protein MJ145_02235 [Clostridia bacterium]|nr:hypothetical protein [Clostridia bacterium]
MKKILTILLTLTFISSMCLFASCTPTYDKDYFTHCKAGIMYDVTHDEVLYEKDADTPYVPASMTKVMTAIVTCKHNPNLEGELTVCHDAVSPMYCSWMDYPHLMEGETISYYQAVEYMLLPSANESANSLAYAVGGGDRQKFVDEMNVTAKEIGCENTEYLDPHGLSPNNHVSARDMVKIAQYAMTFPKIKEILTHESGVVKANDIRDTDIEYTSILYPKYPDLDDLYENPYSKYITGVKTGWIDQSGYNYACSMERDGVEYIIVAMGGDEEDAGDGSGRIIQGDFRDIIEIMSLTDPKE